MLLRGGRREVVGGPVVALEVDGDGVEAGGEEEVALAAAVVTAPVDESGVSVEEDIFNWHCLYIANQEMSNTPN